MQQNPNPHLRTITRNASRQRRGIRERCHRGVNRDLAEILPSALRVGKVGTFADEGFHRQQDLSLLLLLLPEGAFFGLEMAEREQEKSCELDLGFGRLTMQRGGDVSELRSKKWTIFFF